MKPTWAYCEFTAGDYKGGRDFFKFTQKPARVGQLISPNHPGLEGGHCEMKVLLVVSEENQVKLIGIIKAMDDLAGTGSDFCAAFKRIVQAAFEESAREAIVWFSKASGQRERGNNAQV